MSEENKCPECSAPLPPTSPRGLCPACLLKRGLETNTVGFTAEERPGAKWRPPDVETLAQSFPELDIIELIGRGGMGAVYKAREKTLDRLVALKILPPEIARGMDAASPSKNFAQRFAREAQAMAKLNHPNIVTIHSFGQRGELYYFIMEYVDGLSLRQLLNVEQVSPKEALAIVPQICDALQYAHDRGIVHRDIKPENILLNRQGQVKIADFGLAKLVGLSPAGAAAQSTHGAGETTGGAAGEKAPDVTQPGEKVMGTPQYMAPEQMARPQEVDNRADIYSLGVVFYQMLTGELPKNHGALEPPSRKVLIDVRLDEVVLRALEKEPARRYQQVSEVKTQVETIVGTPPVAPPSLAPSVPHEIEQACQAVKAPAIGLIVGLSINIAAVVFWVTLSWVAYSWGNRWIFPLSPAVPVLVSLAICGIILWGIVCMRRLRRYRLSLAVSIAIAMSLPGTLAALWLTHGLDMTWHLSWRQDELVPWLVMTIQFLFSLPMGIWALVVLSRRKVIEAFAAAPTDSGSASQEGQRPAWHRWIAAVGTRSGRPVVNWPGVINILSVMTLVGLVSWGVCSLYKAGGQPIAAMFPVLGIALVAIGLAIYVGLTGKLPPERLVPLDGPTWRRWSVSLCLASLVWLAAWSLVLHWYHRDDLSIVPVLGFFLLEIAAMVPAFRGFLRDRDSGGRTMAIITLATMAGLLAYSVTMAHIPKEQKASDHLATQLAASAWKATLPSGVTVELVGMSESPSTGKPWWRPDGSPLAAAPYHWLGASVTPGRDEQGREFAVRLGNLPREHVSDSWRITPSAGCSIGPATAADGTMRPDLRGAAASIKADQAVATVEVGIAAGAWSTVTSSFGTGASGQSGATADVQFAAAYERDGETTVTVSHNVATNQQVRAIAIDLTGNEHVASHNTTMSSPKVRQETASFDLPVREIKGFQLQARPYEWAEFKNVALHPGQAATAQSATQPIGSSTIRSQYPKESDTVRNDMSTLLVHDDVDLHYAFFYLGEFGSSTSGSHNTHSLTWIDKGSVKLKSGKSFGYVRESADPLHLIVNGEEFDLRKGRVLVLQDDGKVEQIRLFPSLAEANNIDALQKDIASARTAASDWKATLPSGVTVELVGVSENPSTGKPWWRPDGSPLAGAPYARSLILAQPKAGEQAREIAVRMENQDVDSLGFACEVEGWTGTGHAVVAGSAGEEIVRDVKPIIVTLPADRTAVDVRVGVAAGPWKSRFYNSGTRNIAGGPPGENVSMADPVESDGKTTVAVAYDYAGNPQVRVLAIDADGKPHEGESRSLGKGNAQQVTTTFALPLRQIRGFQVQTRPYEWTEFKNVSLRPLAEASTPSTEQVSHGGSVFYPIPSILKCSADDGWQAHICFVSIPVAPGPPGVQIGQPVDCRVDELGGRIYKGKVASITADGIWPQEPHSYDVAVEILNPDADLRDGMPVTLLFLQPLTGSAPSTQPATQPASAGKSPEDSEPYQFGVAADGVQCKLRPNRELWTMGEPISFLVDARNHGQRNLSFSPDQFSALTEVDGRWYGCSQPIEMQWHTTIADVSAGQQFISIPLLLNEQWKEWLGGDVEKVADVRDLKGGATGTPLKWSVGMHTVRVMMFAWLERGRTTDVVRFTSRPVVITVDPTDGSYRRGGGNLKLTRDGRWEAQFLSTENFVQHIAVRQDADIRPDEMKLRGRLYKGKVLRITESKPIRGMPVYEVAIGVQNPDADMQPGNVTIMFLFSAGNAPSTQPAASQPVASTQAARPEAGMVRNHLTIPPAGPQLRYLVRPGDTLESVASKVYGDKSCWTLLAKVNPEANADPTAALEPGTQLVVTKLPTEDSDTATQPAESLWREASIPDRGTKGAPVILELASGEMLPVPGGRGSELQLQYGDIGFDSQLRGIIILRGGKLITPDGRTLRPSERGADASAYELAKLPEEVVVKTGDGPAFKLKVASVTSADGMRIRYAPTAVPATQPDGIVIPDGRTNGAARVLDLATGELLRPAEGLEGTEALLYFTKLGRGDLAFKDGRIAIFRGGKLVLRDGTVLAPGGQEADASVYTVAELPADLSVKTHEEQLYELTYLQPSPDGLHIRYQALVATQPATQPAYDQLMEVIENSKQAQWAHIRDTSPGQKETKEAWIAFEPPRLFSRSGESVNYVEPQTGQDVHYDAQTRTITVRKTNFAPGFGGIVGAHNVFDLYMGWIKQSAGLVEQAQEIVDGRSLTAFTLRGPNGQLRVLVDLGSRRVVRADQHIRGKDGTVSVISQEFDYPATGPANIYELGVPRDARIVSPDTQPATQPAVQDLSPRAPQPAGSSLEFRVVPTHVGGDALDEYREMLRAGKVGQWWLREKDWSGPLPDCIWLPLHDDRPSFGGLVTGEYQGRQYMLVSNGVNEVMLAPAACGPAWGLASVYKTNDTMGQPAIGFQFDQSGGELFNALTSSHLNQPLAIIIDGEVRSAPVVRSAIRERGIIAGRFTEQEVDQIIRALQTGMPTTTQPASLFGPVIERTINDTGENCLIDLDSGKLLTPPKEAPTDSGAAYRWINEHGIDAGGNVQKTSAGLIGFDMVAIPLPNSLWETSSREMLLQAVSTATPGNPVFLVAKDLPTTFIIKTRESSMGVLQIVGFTDNPRAVKIRYKLVLPNSIVAEIARSKLEAAEKELARAEELHRQNAISQEDYDKAKFARDLAVAQLDRDPVRIAKLKVEFARTRLDRLKQGFDNKTISKEEYGKALVQLNTALFELNSVTRTGTEPTSSASASASAPASQPSAGTQPACQGADETTLDVHNGKLRIQSGGKAVEMDRMTVSRPSTQPIKPTAKDLPCPLTATIYELRLPSADACKLDAAALTVAAANPAQFDKALAAAGQAKLLYRIEQSVNLRGEHIVIAENVPVLTSSSGSETGVQKKSFEYRLVGAILDVAGTPGAEGIDVALGLEVTRRIDGQTTGEGPTPMPQAKMAYKGLARPDNAIVILGTDTGSPTAGGEAVVYVARIVLGDPHIVPNAATPGDRTCPLEATIYEAHLSPESIDRLDTAHLTETAADPAGLGTALSQIGEAKVLYRMDQSVKLAGDHVVTQSRVPWVTSVNRSPSGQPVRTVQYEWVGATLKVAGETEPNGDIMAALDLEVSAMSDSPVEIGPGLTSPVTRRNVMAHKGPMKPGRPIVVFSVDAGSLDAKGKAVAYVARVVMGNSDAQPSTQPVAATIAQSRDTQRANNAMATAARTDISSISVALENFEVDTGRYPGTAEGLAALVQKPPGIQGWTGPYIRKMPNDPWGKPYIYRYPGQHNSAGFDLSSAGPDGQEGTGDDVTNWTSAASRPASQPAVREASPQATQPAEQ